MSEQNIKHLLNKVHVGDCLERLKELPDNSIDSCVTDPPYGLSNHSLQDTIDCLQSWISGEVYSPDKKGFMGKEWDAWVPGPEVWKEVYRVLKPGGNLLAFAGTRSMDLMCMAIRLSGFELRDSIGWVNDPSQAPILAWVYASGFPKSQNISKAIDKTLGLEREKVRTPMGPTGNKYAKGLGDGRPWMDKAAEAGYHEHDGDIPVSEQAKRFQGFGSALKPAWEPVVLARKPLDGTLAQNVLKWGTGGLNIDACRVGESGARNNGRKAENKIYGKYGPTEKVDYQMGRYPSNLIHDGSDQVVSAFPAAPGQMATSRADGEPMDNQIYGAMNHGTTPMEPREDDTDSAARFYKSIESNCSLCYNTYTKDYDKEKDIWLKTFVHNAEKNSWTSQAISEFIVRVNANSRHNLKIVQNVKSAGKLCDLCGMSIAVALVGIKTLAFNDEELRVILDYTLDCENSILIQNLVSFAELWGSIDTIPTIQSLTLLFGSVSHAIENYIPGTEKSDQVRFFFVPKASRKDREEDLEGMPLRTLARSGGAQQAEAAGEDYDQAQGIGLNKVMKVRNFHPTVKPTELMQYLCRLVTPKEGIILDPFSGSGSTGKAALLECFSFIGFEKDPEFVEIANNRMAFIKGQPGLF